MELSGRAPVALIMLAQGYGYAGQKDKVLPLLEEAERANIYMCPYETAAAHLTLGDEASRTTAIELLYEAVEKAFQLPHLSAQRPANEGAPGRPPPCGPLQGAADPGRTG